MQIFKDWDRMCKSFEGCHDGCEIMKNTGEATNCGKFVRENPERAIEIIERWIEKHPEKTYKNDFLEKFPKARLSSYKVPGVCVAICYGLSKYRCFKYGNCGECWNAPMEE